MRGLSYYSRIRVRTYTCIPHDVVLSPSLNRPRQELAYVNSRLIISTGLLLLSTTNYETALITSVPQCTANNGVPSLGTCNQIVVDGSIITLGTAEALFTRMLWNNSSPQGTTSTSSYLNCHAYL